MFLFVRKKINYHRYLVSLFILILTACGSDSSDNSITNIDLKFESSESQIAVIDQPFSNPLMEYPESISISYSSSNTDVVTINNSGEITLKSLGMAQITATSLDSDTYTVNDASYELQVKSAYFENGKCQLNSDAVSVNTYTNIYEYVIQNGNCIGLENETITTKKIPVNIQFPKSNFTFSDEVLLSQFDDSDYAYYSLGVKNVSNFDFCFVRITGIKLLNADNEDLIADGAISFTYVNGSLFYNQESDISTNTCLKSNQEGVLAGIYDIGSLESVASFDMTSIYTETVLDVELPALTETGYRWDPELTSTYLNYENNTSSEIKEENSMIFYLNENDEVIYWRSIQNIDTYAEIGSELRLGVRDSGGFNANKFIVNMAYSPVNSHSALVYNEVGEKSVTSVTDEEQSYDIHKFQANLMRTNLEVEADKLDRLSPTNSAVFRQSF